MTGGSTRPESRPYPHGSQSIVSNGQLNVWLHDQRIGTGLRYIIPIAIRVRGQLDVAALRRAFDDVVTRHEILRTVYRVRGGWPVQEVLDPPSVAEALTTVDCAEADVWELVTAAVPAPASRRDWRRRTASAANQGAGPPRRLILGS
ncbi:condensation domain-containing protein [Salinispora arenicola]|uniref:condensation domain-containing protein n=1 Tax=Salinispora arenicola TaxID=168697 RepID=UPI0012BBAE89|nr:condensation domain-containing protein [Salinispora arenicola]